jgi:serine/threonine-protein kinase HipA
MTIEQALFRLYEGLPRNSPGSEQTTLLALRRLGRLPRGARAIDMGCGSGASALVLARRLKSEVVAVDAHEPSLRLLEQRAREQELGSVVVPRHADFSALQEPPGSFDLLWSEGAAYVLGFEDALLKWRPLLKKGGRAAITELSWGQEAPSSEVRDYWSQLYPGMRTVVANCAAAERAGYTVIDTLALTNKDWRGYHAPLKQRIAELRAEGEASAELAVVIDEAEREIAIYEQHGDEFAYVFYLLEKQAVDDVADAAFAEEAEVESHESWSEIDDETDSASPSRRAAKLLTSAGRQAFDDGVAQADRVAHRASELRFAEIVAEIGLERAARLLDAIRARVEQAIR